MYVYDENPWLIIFRRNPTADLRLFCFHYAGGSASIFRNWTDHLPGNVELVAVQLPGREGRFNEDFITGFDDLVTTLVNVIASMLDKPYVVFGHSMGTIKGFELIRKLKSRGLRQPLLYIPAGRKAPHFPDNDPPIAHLSDGEFRRELLKKYPETLENVLQNEKLWEVFVPLLRADFKLCESYRFRDGVKLDCPIVAFAGEEEPDLQEHELQAWADLTTGRFQTKRFPGGHFFIQSAEAQVVEAIGTYLIATDSFDRLPNSFKSRRLTQGVPRSA